MWDDGTEHECSEQFALQLVAQNRAVLVSAPLSVAPLTTHSIAPTVESHDPAPPTTRGKRR